jgi:hypothetical protein
MARDTYAIGTFAQVDNLREDAWDLLRTARPRLTDPTAQRSGTGGTPRLIVIATAIVALCQHPTQPTRYAALVDDAHEDADIRAVVQWFDDPAFPGRKTALLSGPTITLTFPDGRTETRTNHFWRIDAATTLARYNRLRRIVLPDAWSNVTAYAVGDTCWRAIGAQSTPVGFRCLVANTGSAPTIANASWSAYLGPLPAGWDPALA